MKNLILSALIICCSVLAVSAQTANSTPEAVLKNFYSWYIQSIAKNNEPLTKQPTKLKQFITLRLYNEIKKIYDRGELDADYFISAQDYDESWAKNVKVSNVKTAKTKATANVLLDGKEDFDQKLKITLSLEKGMIWKIDKIEMQ